MSESTVARHRLLRPFLCCALLFTTAAGASSMPEPGTLAPDFALVSQAGARVSLKSFKGSWVILFFFGDHPTSDLDLYVQNLERDMDKYGAHHAAVIGIGRSSPESDREWAKRNGISFSLLSDQDQKVSDSYGVPANASNGLLDGGIYQVIIAPDGKVRLPGIVTNDVEDSSAHLLACLEYFKAH